MTSREVQDPPTYVADTHALWWYLNSSDRLSPAADAVFRLVETGNALLIIPAIVVAELYFLSVKLGSPFPPTDLYEALDGVEGVVISPLDRRQLAALQDVHDVPEIHDRLIAAEAFVLDAPIITRDQVLAGSRHVATIW
ncbi:MAG: PIN domain-containing protein [Chloroflexi bacterium]|nr:PIN domain-containing protein [Chloroflexota bacterium]